MKLPYPFRRQGSSRREEAQSLARGINMTGRAALPRSPNIRAERQLGPTHCALIFFLFLFLVVNPLLLAADTISEEQREEGKKLASELRASPPAENSEIKGTLKIRAGKSRVEIPVLCKVSVAGDEWKTIYQTQAKAARGAEQLIVVHSPTSPNQYFYAPPGAPEPKPLKREEANIPFGGSDFWLTDLGLEFLHWPEQRRGKGEMRLGQPCYVLESRNPAAPTMVRVKSWIDKESNGILIAEGYNRDNKLIKEFSLHGSSFKKVNGRWQLEKMEISSPRADSQTTLQFDLPKE